MDYLILRVSNPYGEYHNSDKQGFINVAIRRILQNEKVVICGDGTIARDFIYVKDLAAIIVQLIKMNILNQVINIGSEKGYSINQIINYIIENRPAVEIKYKPSRKYDIQRIILDTNKLNSIENFTFTDIRNGISLTSQGCSENYSKAKGETR